jgi:hypothetical protein
MQITLYDVFFLWQLRFLICDMNDSSLRGLEGRHATVNTLITTLTKGDDVPARVMYRSSCMYRIPPRNVRTTAFSFSRTWRKEG